MGFSHCQQGGANVASLLLCFSIHFNISESFYVIDIATSVLLLLATLFNRKN